MTSRFGPPSALLNAWEAEVATAEPAQPVPTLGRHDERSLGEVVLRGHGLQQSVMEKADAQRP
jgi:hypothetical protein